MLAISVVYRGCGIPIAWKIVEATKPGSWKPQRAERHWLAIAVATLWQVSVGGEVDANLPISSLDELPPTHVARRNFKNSFLHRCLSCFRRGFLVIKAAVLNRLDLSEILT